MTELKKCPFCGGEAEQDDYTQNEYMFHGTGWIGCKKCRVFIDYKNGDYGKNQAIEAWNRRVDTSTYDKEWQRYARELNRDTRLGIILGIIGLGVVAIIFVYLIISLFV